MHYFLPALCIFLVITITHSEVTFFRASLVATPYCLWLTHRCLPPGFVSIFLLSLPRSPLFSLSFPLYFLTFSRCSLNTRASAFHLYRISGVFRNWRVISRNEYNYAFCTHLRPISALRVTSTTSFCANIFFIILLLKFRLYEWSKIHNHFTMFESNLSALPVIRSLSLSLSSIYSTEKEKTALARAHCAILHNRRLTNGFTRCFSLLFLRFFKQK